MNDWRVILAFLVTLGVTAGLTFWLTDDAARRSERAAVNAEWEARLQEAPVVGRDTAWVRDTLWAGSRPVTGVARPGVRDSAYDRLLEHAIATTESLEVLVRNLAAPMEVDTGLEVEERGVRATLQQKVAFFPLTREFVWIPWMGLSWPASTVTETVLLQPPPAGREFFRGAFLSLAVSGRYGRPVGQVRHMQLRSAAGLTFQTDEVELRLTPLQFETDDLGARWWYGVQTEWYPFGG